MMTLNNPREEAFANIVVKGENAGTQHFLLLPQWFFPYQRKFVPSVNHIETVVCNSSEFGRGSYIHLVVW